MMTLFTHPMVGVSFDPGPLQPACRARRALPAVTTGTSAVRMPGSATAGPATAAGHPDSELLRPADPVDHAHDVAEGARRPLHDERPVAPGPDRVAECPHEDVHVARRDSHLTDLSEL